MWEALQPWMLRAELDPVRVENPALPGTPDVNYIEGWLELKHADQWPVRGGALHLKHPPTPQQKVWLFRRWNSGGCALLILRVKHEWFVIAGNRVRDLWKTVPDETAIRLNSLKTFNHPANLADYLTKFKR